MIYHLPERIYDCVKDKEKFKEAEAALKAGEWQTSFAYTKERYEKEYRLFFNMERAVMQSLKGAPEEIVREARIMMRCETPEYLKKQAKKEPDRENRLCCFYQLTNCNIDVEANKRNFLYEYEMATMRERARFSAVMHNVYYIFRGETAVENSLTPDAAIEGLLELRRRVLEVRCDYHDKLEKTTSVEFIAHLLTVYFRFRESISMSRVDKIISMCLDMNPWCGRVYDDVWLGNFRTTRLLGSVLVDRIIKDAPQEKIENAENMLAGYLVSSFSDRANTIKSLTTHNEDFRMMYLVLVAGCIRLLEAVDKEFVEASVTFLMGDEERELILAPMKNTESMTPVTDNICTRIGDENGRTEMVRAFELELRKEFVFLQQFLVKKD